MTDRTNASRTAETEMALREKRELQHQEATRAGVYFEPSVDIYETEDALTLVADVPGTTVEDVDIDLRDSVLTLSARSGPTPDGWKAVHREYRQGGYLRQFRLGQHIDQSKIAARMKDGVLTLTLPKAASAIPKRIRVETAD